jgi:type II secretory pathway pseudopilin PulG
MPLVRLVAYVGGIYLFFMLAFPQWTGQIYHVASLSILMGAAVPSWKYLMKNDREEELLYRGGEIADAIVRFQKKNANAYPTSLEQLVKGKFLRKLYKEPMSKDGKWRPVHQGQAVAPGSNPGQGPTDKNAPTTTTTTTVPAGPSGMGVATGTTLGAIIGVSSTSTEKSLRVFNGRTQYNEWIFAAGQPRQPIPLAIDLQSVRRITIQLEPADGQDIGDQLDLCEARFTK